MSKNYKKEIALILLQIIFFIMMLVSTREIINWYVNNKENEKVSEKISEKISESIITNNENDIKERYDIDFNNLKEKNKDTIAFLKVNGTKIENIVVKGNDNDYYLNHNFEKKNNKAGWIFADYKNKLDGTDNNIIIYGHNMNDGSMFL